jgi:hypothetical protein
MFKRFIVRNIRNFSYKHTHSIFLPNLENQSRIKSLESIIDSQSKTIKYMDEERGKEFNKGFLLGFLTPTIVTCLIGTIHLCYIII